MGKFGMASTNPRSFGSTAPSETKTVNANDAPTAEDEIYAIVADEFETGKLNKGLWIRLFAECGGDEKQTKVLYIKRRAERLMLQKAEREHLAQQEAERFRIEGEEAKNNAKQMQRLNEGFAEPDLIAAVLQGNWSIANKLLSEGCNPLGRDESGSTLLDLALRSKDQQIVDLLTGFIAKRMEPKIAFVIGKFRGGNALTAMDVTMLVDAVTSQPDLARMQSSVNGYTLLHWCARLNLKKLGTALVGLGADAAAKNKDGKQPHELAEDSDFSVVLAKAATRPIRRASTQAR